MIAAVAGYFLGKPGDEPAPPQEDSGLSSLDHRGRDQPPLPRLVGAPRRGAQDPGPGPEGPGRGRARRLAGPGCDRRDVRRDRPATAARRLRRRPLRAATAGRPRQARQGRGAAVRGARGRRLRRPGADRVRRADRRRRGHARVLRAARGRRRVPRRLRTRRRLAGHRRRDGLPGRRRPAYGKDLNRVFTALDKRRKAGRSALAGARSPAGQRQAAAALADAYALARADLGGVESGPVTAQAHAAIGKALGGTAAAYRRLANARRPAGFRRASRAVRRAEARVEARLAGLKSLGYSVG